MAGETYTHISRPVNRLAEKILGWLSWLLLLGTTVVAMFFGLVLFSNESSIQSLENSIANNATLQELLTNNNMNATQFVIMLQNGVWAFIVYLIVCLLISFLALISMNHRIVSGLLFLLVAIVTLPLFFILVPLFFFIIALMMFIRKEKYEVVPTYYDEGYSYGPYANQEPHQQQTETYHEPAAYSEHERPSTEPYQTYDETSAYEASSVNDDGPEVLSRSAKYHQKPQKHQEVSQVEQMDNEADDTLVYDSRAMSRNAAQRQQDDEMATDADAENDAASMSRAEIKQQRKEEKKARKAHEKEQRKLRPSASSQRRQNYDDRMKLQQDRSKNDSQVDKEQ
ncbi:lipoteichoic acid stability factor AuxB [Staphylococcus intermedius]|uniref:Membrane protein n=1 Tax=Staphylococcus intermedius NCTC 11048 TaxID=1141106 RepID=A0A380G8R3_STAIN|nr:DUF4064 domain-containing protein [Staphylococcus intermedius]PCF65214.1 hypothetical protein B5C04_03955 [Staphylococcus intermedius]PCF80825.1 hypothetical protein B4W74_03970 [Staphylococcus intermedius]PCF82174.1 hypothetical protein B4W70_03950 [Staphylococcus intermedius]PCF88510.1 hypothetical protein B4W75_06995 [Staphylococcus intermedius]PCF89225.1 hypothetical protein B4W76_02990 [Staphylococcus intermedius]